MMVDLNRLENDGDGDREATNDARIDAVLLTCTRQLNMTNAQTAYFLVELGITLAMHVDDDPDDEEDDLVATCADRMANKLEDRFGVDSTGG